MTGSTSVAPGNISVANLPGNRVLIAGGRNVTGQVVLDSADVYEGATAAFSTTVFTRGSSPPLDPDGDNIYHFTTIAIPSGTTIRVANGISNRPLVWLASGLVTIDGNA